MNGRLILLAAFPCLAGLAFSYFMVVRAQERARRMAQRLDQALHRDRSGPTGSAAGSIRASGPAAGRAMSERLAGVLGADLTRRELYQIPWWLVPVPALAVAVGCAAIAELLVGQAAWMATPGLGWLICRKYFTGRHQGRVASLFGQFPEALSTIVRAVRVGIPISEAIRAVASEATEPTRSAFARLADDVAIGAPLDEALRTMAERDGVPEYRFFATAMSLQAQTGGGISETLENLADVIRKRVAARARGKALAAEARTSAIVLSVLPVIALAGLWLMSPQYIGVLFVTQTGHTLLAAAALLLGFGTFVMRLMIQKSLS